MAFRHGEGGLSPEQSDAVIAALRLLATGLKERLVLPDDGDIGAILTNGGQHIGLTYDEVIDLGDIFMNGRAIP